MRVDPKTGYITTEQLSVALPERRKRDIPWLLTLAFFVPPLAVYLDGASQQTYMAILWIWIWGILFWIPLPIAMVWAIVYIFRSSDSRQMARPARYRLWVQRPPGKKPFEQAPSPPGDNPTSPPPGGAPPRQSTKGSSTKESGGGAAGAADGGGGRNGGDGGGGSATVLSFISGAALISRLQVNHVETTTGAHP